MREWLRDIPDRILTERLVIRPHRKGDGPELYAAVMDSLEDLRKWPAAMGWALREQSPEDLDAFCAAAGEAFAARSDFPLLITLRDNGAIVGSSGLHRPDWNGPTFEVGWWGRSTYGKQGLLTEAVAAILDYAFVHLRACRVFAVPDDENAASVRICERVGMTLEGVTQQERAEPDGTLRNTRLYAMVR
jgi:RimJ/RimL family protein N-acetyltransferase